MDPARKRKFRFVIALSCALLLASALIYTSFSASSEARSPSQLAAAAKPGQVYELTGKVEPGSISSQGTTHTFRVRDREGHVSVPVSYTGALPDPFRDGPRDHRRRPQAGRDLRRRARISLITKCPSKFTAEKKT